MPYSGRLHTVPAMLMLVYGQLIPLCQSIDSAPRSQSPLQPALNCFGWLLYDGDHRHCMGLFRGIDGVKHDFVKSNTKAPLPLACSGCADTLHYLYLHRFLAVSFYLFFNIT